MGDLLHLLELHGVRGTYTNWWSECKDRKTWTKAIHNVVAIHTWTLDQKQAIIVVIIVIIITMGRCLSCGPDIAVVSKLCVNADRCFYL
jgi:hypothetical protein